MGFGIIAIVHVVLAVLLIIELGLTGYSKHPTSSRTTHLCLCDY